MFFSSDTDIPKMAVDGSAQGGDIAYRYIYKKGEMKYASTLYSPDIA